MARSSLRPSCANTHGLSMGNMVANVGRTLGGIPGGSEVQPNLRKDVAKVRNDLIISDGLKLFELVFVL